MTELEKRSTTVEGVYAEVGRQGAVILVSDLIARIGGPAFAKLCKGLTVTERVVPGGRPLMAAKQRRCAFQKLPGNRILVPRGVLSMLLKRRILTGIRAGAGTDSNAPLPEPRGLGGLELAAPLFPYQEAAVDYLAEFLGTQAGNGVAYLRMETGLGKTRVGIALAMRLDAPVLVVVPTDAIAGQWLEEAAAAFPAARCAQYANPRKGAKRPPPAAHAFDLVVVVINTFRDKTPEFLEGFGMVILDEAHEYQSPCNIRGLWLAQTRHVLGLSATPLERPDGLDRVVTHFLGPPLDPREFPGFDTAAVDFRVRVRRVEYRGHPDYCAAPLTAAGTVSAVGTIGAFMRDPHRARLVAAEVLRLYTRHATATPAELADEGLGPHPDTGIIRRHGVLVFAELREALPMLREALVAALGEENVVAPELSGFGDATQHVYVPSTSASGTLVEVTEPSESRLDAALAGLRADAPKMSILRGGVATGAVADARAAGAHVVLTTYGFSRRGISLQEMTALVLATPRRNGSTQIIGRILRRGSDESIVRQIVDIVDTGTALKGQAATRMKAYAARGYPVTRIRVAWDAFSPEGSGRPSSETKKSVRGDVSDAEDDADDSALLATLYGCAAE